MSVSPSVVTSYQNPDLDGVACATVLASCEEGSWRVVVSGHLNAETTAVLQALDIDTPPEITEWDSIERIWLVDTHHPVQLPRGLPLDRVVGIIDHHPDGNPQAFPNASIQNDDVGAAATLVFEQYRPRLSVSNALLLQAAILSNTLSFTAPATTDRDHRAFASLRNLAPLPDRVRDAMRSARRSTLDLPTREIVRRDLKTFDVYGRVVVAQVEANGAIALLERMDLFESLQELASSENAEAAAVNIVDTECSESAVMSSSESLIRVFADAWGVPVGTTNVIRMRRILQRKTDIVPLLSAFDSGHRR